MTTPPGRGFLKKAAATLRTPAAKIPEVSTDRNVATAPAPSAAPGIAQTKAEIRSLLLLAPTPEGSPTQLIYEGDALWRRVTLELKTGGPVAVGTSTEIAPAPSGKGILLLTDQPRTFELARGVKLYAAVTALNRVSMTIEPVPWMEEIAALVRGVLEGIVALATGKRAP